MVEIGLPDPTKTGGCVDHIREYFEKAIKDHPFKTSTFFMGRGQKLAKFGSSRGEGVKNCENLPKS